MTHPAIPPCSGIILAGGLSSRFGGRNKALIEWKGRPLLAHIRQAFGDLFQEIILVTNAPGAFAAWDMTLVTDLFAERSSLTGIHAGLFYADHPLAFVTACDTPLLQPAEPSSTTVTFLRSPPWDQSGLVRDGDAGSG